MFFVPFFTEPLKLEVRGTIRVKLGDRVTLFCTGYGTEPVLMWQRYPKMPTAGIIIKSNTSSPDFASISLDIRSVKRSSNGSYECGGSNAAGKKMKITHVIVLGKNSTWNVLPGAQYTNCWFGWLRDFLRKMHACTHMHANTRTHKRTHTHTHTHTHTNTHTRTNARTHTNTPTKQFYHRRQGGKYIVFQVSLIRTQFTDWSMLYTIDQVYLRGRVCSCRSFRY